MLEHLTAKFHHTIVAQDNSRPLEKGGYSSISSEPDQDRWLRQNQLLSQTSNRKIRPTIRPKEQ